jgi:HAD superfamily hydrolase (TIGR01549 family)
MKNYTTYIFDLDGTITDTTSVWLDIFRDGLQQFGVTAPENRILANHTHDWRQMLELGLAEKNLDEFTQLAHKLAKERLPEAPLHADAYTMLETLKQSGKNVAIFSTMDRPIFEPTMQHRGLDKITSVAIAGTDVPNRKPHPDGILKALDDLGVAKEDYASAVYIGDKDTDILAAQNAGIEGVLYYPASHQLIYNLDELSKHNPTAVITDWQELLSAA